MSKRSRTLLVHKQVQKVAKEAAANLYESLMSRDNELYAAWKKKCGPCTEAEWERRFIEKYWPSCVEFARATMARLLESPTIDESTKEEIMEALKLDNTLTIGRRGRDANAQLLGIK
jgi:hypothetical protein